VRRKQDDDVVDNHSLKRDARRLSRDIGESYQTALKFLRRLPPAARAVASARGAVIAGDRRPLDRLLAKELDLPTSEQWLAALEMALMDDALTPVQLDEDCLTLLRALTRSEHRRLTPLWMRATRGGRVLLSDQLGFDLAHNDSPEAGLLSKEIGDERLNSVLARLTQQEQQVVQTWATLGGSWVEAAFHVGMAAETGDRVRRKLKRLGAEQIRRAEAVK
jgi:hypothetical protein